MSFSASAKIRVLAGLALILLVALGAALSSLYSTRDELHSVIAANMSLRTTLGDMTREITANRREIDRLSLSTCSPQSGSPETGAVPARKSALR